VEIKIPTQTRNPLNANLSTPSSGACKHVIVINGALGIDKSFYQPLASFLSEQGFMVITYNYDVPAAKTRSITVLLRRLGALQFNAVINWAREMFDRHQIHAVGHGVGGVIIGYAPQISSISCIVTINSQLLHMRDLAIPAIVKWAFAKVWHNLKFKLTGQIANRRSDSQIDDLEFNSQRLGLEASKMLLSQRHKKHFHEFKGRLLSLRLSDDALTNKTSHERLHNQFSNAIKFVRRVYPSDVEVQQLGFTGFFAPHPDHQLWHMTASYCRENFVYNEKALAEFDDVEYPIIIIRLSSRDPDENIVSDYFKKLIGYLQTGPVYFVIDLTHVHWGGSVSSFAKPVIAHYADLIRKNHRGTTYVAPNFFVRKLLFVFHKMEVNPIIKPVQVFKSTNLALASVRAKLKEDKSREGVHME
jgi:hypothetical protein